MIDFSRKKVCITGGTSFLSHHLTRYLLDNGCEYIRLTSRDEVKQANMKELFDDDRLNFILSDIRNYKSTEYTFYDIDYVFHTAAYKRTDSLERAPWEAIETNTVGAKNVIDAAIRNGVEKVIGISTDKASLPISIYGASKFAAEKLLSFANNYSGSSGTQFSCVRYGNVFDSTGSLVKILREQKRRDIPFTITHPEMTRFFMLPHSAVQLIQYALDNMKGNGEIFIPKSPSFRIVDMAKALDEARKIEYIGLRGIEKMHETLIAREEMLETIEDDNYYTILPIKEIHKNRWVYPHNKWEDINAYTSDTNSTWLTIEQLKNILHRI